MKNDTKPTSPTPVSRSRKRNRGAGTEAPFGKLIVIYGDHVGKEYRLGAKRVLIGRADQCDIPINDSSVSRKHASIETKDGRFLLRDLQSTNGTVVNNKRIDAAVLNHGDKIRIGRAVFKFLEREITVTI
jgi:pSer/pThr/pTyr-binding forkhead associated (FHA) protein